MDIYITLVVLLAGFPLKACAVSRCTFYEDPKNGYITCDSLFHLFCSPECHPGFRFATKPAVVYMCGPVTGEWFTYPVGSGLPWPDCVPDDRGDRTIHEELTRKRDEISRHINDANTGIPTPYYSPATTLEPEERYHHLFNYIEKAQKAYEYREAIEKETEKLKQENKASNANIYETHNHLYEDRSVTSGRQSSRISPKVVTVPNNPASTNHQGFTKVSSAKEPRITHAQFAGFKNYLYPGTTHSPGTQKEDGQNVTSNKNYVAKANSSTLQGSSYLQRPQNTALSNIARSNIARSSSNSVAVGRKKSSLKDSDFVLKMLSDEEFKDLHYLDEHVRFNRDAQLSQKLNSTNSKSEKFKKNDGELRKGNLQEQVYLRANTVLDSAKDKFANTNATVKEKEELSGHIVPIVIGSDSLASLLQRHNGNTTITTPTERAHRKNIVQQMTTRNNLMTTEITPYDTAKIVKPPSLGNKVFSFNSQLKPNEKHQGFPQGSNVGPSSKNTSIGMREIYKAWLKKHQSGNKNTSSINQSLLGQAGGKTYSDQHNVHTIERQNDNANLEITKNNWENKDMNTELVNYAKASTSEMKQRDTNNTLPRQTEVGSSNQKVNNTMLLNETKTFHAGLGGEKKTANPEHLFYFPIKKDTLFKLLNGTKPRP